MMPRLSDPDPDLPALTFMADARRAGLNRHQVKHRVRSGAWQQVSWGSYVPSARMELDPHVSARQAHELRAIAAALRNPGTVITDASAAVLHGLAVNRIPSNVQLAVPPGRWSGTRSGIDFRVRDFDDEQGEVTSTGADEGEAAVASVLRCWIDITRFGSLTDSLVCGDAAMRQGLLSATPDAQGVVVAHDRWRGQRGCRRLALAAPLLSGLRESPLESSSFAYFVRNQIPLPQMQVELLGHHGEFVARVDFYWPSARLVGEADGSVKYDSRESLFAEKRREDEIRALGFGVVRWSAGDLRNGRLASRLRRALR